MTGAAKGGVELRHAGGLWAMPRSLGMFAGTGV